MVFSSQWLSSDGTVLVHRPLLLQIVDTLVRPPKRWSTLCAARKKITGLELQMGQFSVILDTLFSPQAPLAALYLTELTATWQPLSRRQGCCRLSGYASCHQG